MGVKGVLGCWELYKKRTPIHEFLIHLTTKLCSICHRLAAFPTSNYGPQFDPALGSGLTYEFENGTGTHRDVVFTFLFHFYVHSLYVYLAPFSYNAQHSRQTYRHTADRAIGIGCQCYSIGGLKDGVLIAAAVNNNKNSIK